MLEALLSNNRMKAELSAAVRNGKPMQAYLFCGAAGSGKSTAARLLAYELVGQNREKVLRNTHPDVMTVEPIDGKKLISVEQIRNMRAESFIKPNEGERKIYIINGIHLMNDAGQNALLTVLEQPPSFAVFILLSESRGRVLPTVISRCSTFEMEYVDASEGTAYLKNKFPQLSGDRLKMSVSAACGNLGLAEKLAASDAFEADVAKSERLAVAIAARNEYAAASAVASMTKAQLTEFLPVLLMYLRDIAVYLSCGDSEILVFRESILKNSAAFVKIDINMLYDGISACNEALELIGANVNPTLAMMRAVILLCGGKNIG